MALESDPERAHQRATEQTPLLTEQEPVPIEEDEEEEEVHSEPAEETPKKRSKSWYAWRIFWAIIAALIIAVFVKGWIDADDTEVCFLCVCFD